MSISRSAVTSLPAVPSCSAPGKKEKINCIIPNKPMEYAKHKYRTRNNIKIRLTIQIQITASGGREIPKATAASETSSPITSPLQIVRQVSVPQLCCFT
ncbi:hypothetical protein D3C75_903720 [compost metagenome]